MKKILLFAILISSLEASSQTMIDIYKMLPEKIGFGNLVEREIMATNYKKGIVNLDKTIHYRFDIVDDKNGFLSVKGIFEGLWEMCYWNIGDEKLIAVYHQGCGPVCYVENFDFFILKDNKLYPKDINLVIPGYNEIGKDFFISYSEQLVKELDNKNIVYSLIFKIPQNGKDIVAFFGNENTREIYSNFFKGDRMVLKWNNGMFKKGEIYWNK